MKEKIFTPKRIIGIIFLIVLLIFVKKMNTFDNGYNVYPEDTSVLEEDFGAERDNYLKAFFDLLAENNYVEAYSMLDDGAKIDTFATIEGFSSYFKDHIIDNNKVKKEVTLRWKNSDKNKNVISHYYDVVLSINPTEFSKLNVTFDEILSFYDGRCLNVTVLQKNPYDYKIFMLKPNIPLTQKELEEYTYKE